MAAVVVSLLPAAADDLSWIDASCCRTNGCCYEIPSTDLVPLPGDNYRVIASGQVVRRTDYSPDGKTYRCACDNVGGRWVVHPAANTRCLFVPHQGS